MGRLELTDPTLEVPKPYLKSVLSSLRDAFRASGPLAVSSFSGLGRDTVTYAMATAIQFQIADDGRVQNSRLIATSLSSTLDSTALGAVARADSEQLLLPMPGNVDKGAVFRFTTYVESDTSKGASGNSVTGPLVRTTVPVWTSFTMPGMIRHMRPPEYPARALAAHAQDSVMVVFMVDESGVVIPNTVYLTSITYREFGLSVLKWMYTARPRYHPAIVGGCPAKFLVEQPFTYKMR
jgi:TonB family protein